MNPPSPSIKATSGNALDRLTPTAKVARGLAMLDWTRRWISRQIVAERGPMPPARLRLEVARRLYQGDPATCRLIDMAIAESSADVSA